MSDKVGPFIKAPGHNTNVPSSLATLTDKSLTHFTALVIILGFPGASPLNTWLRSHSSWVSLIDIPDKQEILI